MRGERTTSLLAIGVLGLSFHAEATAGWDSGQLRSLVATHAVTSGGTREGTAIETEGAVVSPGQAPTEAQPLIEAFPLPDSFDRAYLVTTSSKGDVWFAFEDVDATGRTIGSRLGRITGTGEVTDVIGLSPVQGALGLVASGGTVWLFGEPSGWVRLASESSFVSGSGVIAWMLIGPDDVFWWAGRHYPRFIVGGDIAVASEYRVHLPDGLAFPFGYPPSAAFDREGNLWFSSRRSSCETSCSSLSRLDVRTRTLNTYPAEALLALTSGPDGNVWGQRTYGSPGLARIKSSGDLDAFFKNVEVHQLTAGAGYLWGTASCWRVSLDSCSVALLRMDVSDLSTVAFPVPSSFAIRPDTLSIAPHADGVWFTARTNAVYRFHAPVEPTRTPTGTPTRTLSPSATPTLTPTYTPRPGVSIHVTAVGGVANDGNCTLSEAIRAAETDAPVDNCRAGTGADTIDLPRGIYGLSGAVVRTHLRINGMGSVISGTDVLSVEQGGVLRLNDTVLADSTRAIANRGLLELSGCQITRNSSPIVNYGTLTLDHCVVNENSATHGGAVANFGTLRVIDSSFTANHANDGPITNCLTFIKRGQSGGNGGGIYNQGGHVTSFGALLRTTGLGTAANLLAATLVYLEGMAVTAARFSMVRVGRWTF